MLIEKFVKYGCGRLRVCGVELDQHPNAESAFRKLFSLVDIKRVIEFGTSRGGLSLLLRAIKKDGYDLITYDINSNLHNPKLLSDNGIEFRKQNVFKSEKEVGSLIKQDGLTLVLCDNGKKPIEFATFAKYLKSGDIIMVHDYGETREQYLNEIHKNRIWDISWLSCTGEQIRETCAKYNLEPFMGEEFLKAVWGCRRKR